MSKLKKKGRSSSKDVSVSIPITKVSIMTVVVLLLASLVGYSGYLGVKSIWKFTHPNISISLDTFKALGYIAENKAIPSFAIPSISGDYIPDEVSRTAFIQAMSEYEREFLSEFPNSRLAQIPDNALVGLGWSFCQAKKKSINESGTFSKEEIIKAHQGSLLLRYWQIKGLNVFLEGLGERAFENLCKES